MTLKRFTRPKFLEQIARPFLEKLLARLLADSNVAFPDANLNDKQFYAECFKLVMAPEELPKKSVDALYAIETLSTLQGNARLLSDLEGGLEPYQTLTHAEVAVHFFLTNPDYFARVLNKMDLKSWNRFEYWSSNHPVDRTLDFSPPVYDLVRFKAEFDQLVGRQRNGNERATQIIFHVLDREHLFLIRRGDAYTRQPVVEGKEFGFQHFRPACDLGMIYSPVRDELRVHASGIREPAALRHIFGKVCFGDDDYFANNKIFTLEPLRDAGADALIPPPGSEIERIVLKQLKVQMDDEFDGVRVLEATDCFAHSASEGQPPIPARGRLVEARFGVYFQGANKPKIVHLRPPNKLSLPWHIDAAVVHKWLAAKGFRLGRP